MEHGILYPTPLEANNHARISAHFFGYEGTSYHNKLRHNFDQSAVLDEGRATWQSILAELQNHDVDTAILSAELLFGAGKHDGFDDFVAALRRCADTLHVVAYIRSPAEHYLSLKQQNLKHDLPRLLPRENSNNRVALERYMNADGVILHVHPFDRGRMHDGDIVSDFFKRHLSPAALDAVVRPPADENTSLSPEAMVVLDELRYRNTPRRYAHYGKPSEDYADLIRRIDNEIPGKTRPKYKPGVAQKIFDAKQDLEWLDTTFGIHFERPVDDPAADDLTLNDLKAVRSLCYIDEERYHQFWATLPPPENARMRWIGRKLRNVAKHPLRAVSNISKLPTRFLGTRPTKT